MIAMPTRSLAALIVAAVAVSVGAVAAGAKAETLTPARPPAASASAASSAAHGATNAAKPHTKQNPLIAVSGGGCGSVASYTEVSEKACISNFTDVFGGYYVEGDGYVSFHYPPSEGGTYACTVFVWLDDANTDQFIGSPNTYDCYREAQLGGTYHFGDYEYYLGVRAPGVYYSQIAVQISDSFGRTRAWAANWSPALFYTL